MATSSEARSASQAARWWAAEERAAPRRPRCRPRRRRRRPRRARPQPHRSAAPVSSSKKCACSTSTPISTSSPRRSARRGGNVATRFGRAAAMPSSSTTSSTASPDVRGNRADRAHVDPEERDRLGAERLEELEPRRDAVELGPLCGRMEVLAADPHRDRAAVVAHEGAVPLERRVRDAERHAGRADADLAALDLRRPPRGCSSAACR